MASSASASLVAPIPEANSGTATSGFAAVGFCENDHFIRLSLDLPTVEAKDISVELQRGVLLVRGSREVKIGSPGTRHEHKFCRRFAMDTDVVNAQRIQANLNKRGVLTIMAPKMRLPTTLQIAVTEEEDTVFEASLSKSFRQQQEQAAEEEEEKKEAKTTTASKPKEERQEKEVATTSSKVLPNVVSMGSTTDALQSDSEKNVKVKRRYKTSPQSHLMIRRSMSNNKLRKNGNDNWASS